MTSYEIPRSSQDFTVWQESMNLKELETHLLCSSRSKVGLTDNQGE